MFADYCPLLKDQRQITIFTLHSLDEDNDKHLSFCCLPSEESYCNL